MTIDLPPAVQQERVVCSVQAAAQYQLDPLILLAVASNENGRPGQWVRNKNGTHDVGAMQLNTAYLATLAKYGVTPQDAARPGCYSYFLAAWRIKRHIVRDRGDLWTRVANYHSYTPRFNSRYRQKLIRHAEMWRHWFQSRGIQTANLPNSAATQTVAAERSRPVRHDPVRRQERRPGQQPATVARERTATTARYTDPRTTSSVVWRSPNPTIE